MSEPLVEIRVPTFRRPELLRRALNSLVAQTHRNWRAIVYDDSPSREGRQVCADMADTRITYAPNHKNLGLCVNLDKAFREDGCNASFICVLEDDNYYLPSNIASNLAIAAKAGVDIVLRNQLIEEPVSKDANGLIRGRTMFEGQYPEGVLAHDALFSSFFYSTGASNSSLFWRAQADIDFSTLSFADDAVVQERLRTLCIDRDVYVAMEPTIIWRDNGSESLRPKLRGLRWYVGQVQAASYERSIYKMLWHYLSQKSLQANAFVPPQESFGPSRERVFHRVGIRVPSSRSNMDRKLRLVLHLKRKAASAAALLLHSAVVSGSIDPVRRRLAPLP